MINKEIKKNTVESDPNLTNQWFLIDAKDQIACHKWARENDLEVLCCAHSHPSGENKPSEMDLLLHQSPGLMVISNKDGELKAWWVQNKLNFHWHYVVT